MTKSSMPRRAIPCLILLIAPGALAAQSPTPEEAIAQQRAELREVVNQVCPPGAVPNDPNNVVVCGRREGYPRYRVPEAIPEGSRLRETAGGEQRLAMDADGCRRLCSQPVVLPLLTISFGGPGGGRRTAVDEIRDALGGRPD